MKIIEPLFQENEYRIFVGGTFIIGGLIVLPLIWGYVFGLARLDSAGYYPGVLIPSLILCIGILIAYKKNGKTTSIRLFGAFLIGIFVSSILGAIKSSSAISEVLFGYISLLLSGLLPTRLVNKILPELRKSGTKF